MDGAISAPDAVISGSDDAISEPEYAIAVMDDAIAEAEYAVAVMDDAVSEAADAISEGDGAISEADDAIAGPDEGVFRPISGLCRVKAPVFPASVAENPVTPSRPTPLGPLEPRGPFLGGFAFGLGAAS